MKTWDLLLHNIEMEQSWTLEHLIDHTDAFVKELKKNETWVKDIAKTLSLWSTHELFPLPGYFSFPSMNAIYHHSTKSFENLLDQVRNHLARFKGLEQSLRIIRQDLEYLHDRNTKTSYDYKHSAGKLEREIERLEHEQKSDGSLFKHELVRKDKQKIISEYSELQVKMREFEKEAHCYFHEAVKRGNELASRKEEAFTFNGKNQHQGCWREVSNFEEENLLGQIDEKIVEEIHRLEQEVVARFLEAPLVESIQSEA